ncbi:hypothetical protein CHS0354_011372 [Potamilus streckersoni]|uniref:Uncharacterized protein n=1 Tax=Potamilus streckersoni TaxID=2493646 RepID=A0AAE0W583_9BIVA|nr:hypothetical protein CHS0354_011372 [Potamilus streckersoni]
MASDTYHRKTERKKKNETHYVKLTLLNLSTTVNGQDHDTICEPDDSKVTFHVQHFCRLDVRGDVENKSTQNPSIKLVMDELNRLTQENMELKYQKNKEKHNIRSLYLGFPIKDSELSKSAKLLI